MLRRYRRITAQDESAPNSTWWCCVSAGSFTSGQTRAQSVSLCSPPRSRASCACAVDSESASAANTVIQPTQSSQHGPSSMHTAGIHGRHLLHSAATCRPTVYLPAASLSTAETASWIRGTGLISNWASCMRHSSTLAGVPCTHSAKRLGYSAIVRRQQQLYLFLIVPVLEDTGQESPTAHSTA